MGRVTVFKVIRFRLDQQFSATNVRNGHRPCVTLPLILIHSLLQISGKGVVLEALAIQGKEHTIRDPVLCFQFHFGSGRL